MAVGRHKSSIAGQLLISRWTGVLNADKDPEDHGNREMSLAV
jgi:hypothetical protein